MKTAQLFCGLLGVVLLAAQASAGEATKLADLDGQAHAGSPTVMPFELLPTGDLPLARGNGCGEPGSGSCCVSSGTPYCECEGCCEIVCAVDPFCCDTAWDSICADEALDLCTDCACGGQEKVVQYSNTGDPVSWFDAAAGTVTGRIADDIHDVPGVPPSAITEITIGYNLPNGAGGTFPATISVYGNDPNDALCPGPACTWTVDLPAENGINIHTIVTQDSPCKKPGPDYWLEVDYSQAPIDPADGLPHGGPLVGNIPTVGDSHDLFYIDGDCAVLFFFGGCPPPAEAVCANFFIEIMGVENQQEQTGACCDHAAPGGACQDDVLESQCVSGELKEYKISAELPIPDEDPAGVRHEFFVPDRGIIGDLDVDLLISHTWRNDLIVTVTHKDTGTSAILTAFPNSGADDNIGNPATLEKVFFDDEAGELFDNVVGDSPVGHYRPTEPLSAFDGEDKFGLWSIFVEDAFLLDVGILHQWSLNFLNEGPAQAEWFKDLTCGDVEEQGLCDEHTGACCDPKGNGCIDDVPETECPTDDPRVTWFKGLHCDELDTPCRPRSVSITDKGSLLIFPKVEIKWDAAGNVTQDTFLDITNDYPKDVFVQLYFVNGDEPADPMFGGDPPQLIERGHPGWNWVDCQILLTNDQPMYWSALTGSPLGCQMFTVLDPGTPPGRPDLDGAPGSRVLRGFVYAWAVDQWGEEICWNHLKGDAVIVNYADPSAWEYNAYAAKTTDKCDQGNAPDDNPGHICLNGYEYDASYDRLLLDFYASGSTALSGGGAVVSVDTDLTLFPVDADLRQDTCGPILTKAKFDIWNMNEIRFSGTTRCITCWDQTLLSNYDPPNHFLLGNLHTDKGKARIDGIASQVCDANDCTDCEWPKFPPCSQDSPLLGVVKKELAFSGGATGRAAAGMTLVGMGEESTCIWYDIIEPPEELQGQFDNGIAPVEDASQARTKVRK